MKIYLKVLGLYFVASVLILFNSIGLASAHVLKEGQGVSAVLHIPPEDNPVAGQPTELDISFGDKNNNFSLLDCSCQLLIVSGGKVLQKLVPSSALSGATLDSVVTAQFPHVGVYHIIISGSAKDDKFNDFKLDYSVRVASDTNGTAMKNGNGDEALVVGSGGLIILALLAYRGIVRGGRFTRPTQPSSKSKR